MTFFKKEKKCFFAPPRRSYIPNFRWIERKLRPAASGQTDKHTNKLTDNSHGPTIPSNLQGPTIGTAKQGCAYGARTMNKRVQIYYHIASRSPSAIATRFDKVDELAAPLTQIASCINEHTNKILKIKHTIK